MSRPARCAAALLLLSCACDSARAPPPAPRSAPPAALHCAYATDPTPRLRLRGAGPGHPFGSVTGAVLGPRNEIVVADRLNHRVWFFDSAGTHVATAGGRGAGPGEFQRIWSIHRLDSDTILIEDVQLRRFTFYTPDGRLVRTERFADGVPAAAPVIGRLPDASWLHAARSWSAGRGRTTYQDTVRVERYSADGRFLGAAGPFRGIRRYEDLTESFNVITLPFERGARFAVLGGLLVVTEGTEATVQLRRPDGTLERTLAVPDMGRAVDAELAQAYRGDRLATARNPATLRRILDDLPFPERTPPYGEFAIDRTGAIWLGAYPLPGEKTSRFIAVDTTGTVLEDLRLPYVMQLLDAGASRVLGRVRDELDVESLVVLARACTDGPPTPAPIL